MDATSIGYTARKFETSTDSIIAKIKLDVQFKRKAVQGMLKKEW